MLGATMSDTSSTTGASLQNDAPAGADRSADRLDATLNRAKATISGITSQASDAKLDLKSTVSDLTETAKGLASDASDRLRTAAEGQKAVGADYLGRIAGAIRRAGDEIESDIPQVGPYVRMAARQMDQVSDAVRRKDVGELLDTVKQFAQRQPTAFLLVSVLTGFVAVRFLRTSSSASSSSGPSTTPSRPMNIANWAPQRGSDYQSLATGGDPGGISPAAPGFA